MLGRHGHDALHTRDLADQNATSDSVINPVSIAEQRVVISKDSDFFYSHLLHGSLRTATYAFSIITTARDNTSLNHPKTEGPDV
jgi:predicted nuclease of predicted toxin-antitoxin system